MEILVKCIALNDKWAKGHVRLASAYIALGGHSNDACNSLQRAVSLDPSNRTARHMLIQELKRRDVASRGGGGEPSRSTNATPHHNQHQHGVEHDVVERLSIKETIHLYWIRSVTWYQSQPEDVKTLLKVMAALVILYVTFGGRFGLELFGSHSRGHSYGVHDNEYKHYRASPPANNGFQRNHNQYNPHSEVHQHAQQPHNEYVGDATFPQVQFNGGATQASTDYNSGGANEAAQTTNGGGQTRYHEPAGTNVHQHSSPHSRMSKDDNYDYRRSATSTASFQFPNLFDGSFPSILCLLGVAYICHRNGINPFQVFFWMNMLGAGHRGVGYGGYGGYGMGYGLGGMGMAGMGYGMAQNAGIFGGRYAGRPGYR